MREFRKIRRNGRPGSGLSVPHDHPLGFHWRPIDPAAFDGLGLPAPASGAEAAARAAILTDAVLIGRADPERMISYSRDRNVYGKATRYRHTAYTYRTVVRWPGTRVATEVLLIFIAKLKRTERFGVAR